MVRITARHLIRLGAAIVLAVTAGLATPTAATAAVPNPLYIQSVMERSCLDQHYNNGPTVTVYAWPRAQCHSQGNQQWGFFARSANTYEVRNHRGGWCLSHPNRSLELSRIYAEICTGELKQVWRPILTRWGWNLLKNEWTGRCMYVVPSVEVHGGFCPDPNGNVDPRYEWRWQPQPF